MLPIPKRLSMRVRDHKKEYRRKKQLEMGRQAGKAPVSHFKIASDALWAVITGYRQSHDLWTDDVDRANECIRMAFKKDDKVFEIANVLLRKYNALERKGTKRGEV